MVHTQVESGDYQNKNERMQKQQHLKKWINKVSNTTKSITSLSNVRLLCKWKKYFIHPQYVRKPFEFLVRFSFLLETIFCLALSFFDVGLCFNKHFHFALCSLFIHCLYSRFASNLEFYQRVIVERIAISLLKSKWILSWADNQCSTWTLGPDKYSIYKKWPLQ